MSAALRLPKILRILLIAIWASVIILVFGLFLYDPEAYSARNIAEFLRQNTGSILAGFVIVSALRGLTLLPSTPLVLAGILLFPDQPITVFLISVGGIAFSSAMIYFFSEALGFDDFFMRRKPKLVNSLHQKLETPFGYAFVALWAFFPAAPTDAICYVAGIVRMNFWLFLAAIIAGEAILCAIYIWGGRALFN